MLGCNAFLLEPNVGVLLNDTRKWAALGLSFSITTLGFLIAGFTIFATLSRPNMMLAMMDHINEKTGLPTLKYNFFSFMKVFIAYIFFSLFYLFVVLFGQDGGFLSNVVRFIPDSDCVRVGMIQMGYIISGVSFVYLILLLKSFVFNIYATVMNFLRWEYVQEIERKKNNRLT